MIATRSFSILLGGLLALACAGSAARAEDFSVDLTRLAEMDAARSMPEYKLDRVLTNTEVERGSGLPEKTFDVFIRFKKFGAVRLDEAGEGGWSAGKMNQTKSLTFCYGLANLADVKMAWLKDAPDLFIVAWVVEPDGRGIGHAYSHGYVILQLKDRHALMLLRGHCAINARVLGGIQEGATDYSRFSFDAKRGLLEERKTRYYELVSDRHQDLTHRTKDADGHFIYTASIDETIHFTYQLTDGKLVPRSCGLVYKTQKQDELSEIARFYLGPLAPRRVVLEANAPWAAKYKDKPPGEMIYLDEGLEIRIPVPEKWLMDNFVHGLVMQPGKG